MPLSTLTLVGANLLPLVGVVFWGWDAFVLLILYWLETAVIGVWTVVRILLMPAANRDVLTKRIGGARQQIGGIAAALFTTVHAGIFMTVHFLFLWSLFAGAWAERVHGPAEFAEELVWGTGLWLPLLILFLLRGWFVLRPLLLGEAGDADVFSGLYVRIVVMQVAIILGGWLAMLVGGIGTLVLLVIGKTLAEFFSARLSATVGAATAKAAAERDGAA